MTLSLLLFPESYTIGKFDPAHGFPAWVAASPFYAVIRTHTELSVVAASSLFDKNGVQEPGWRLLGVEGPLDFSMTGVMAALATPLAEAGISILPLATFDTDYLLVQAADLEKAVAVLRKAGHQVSAFSPPR